MTSQITFQKLPVGRCFLVYDRARFIGGIEGSRGEWTAYPANDSAAGWGDALAQTFTSKETAAEALAA